MNVSMLAARTPSAKILMRPFSTPSFVAGEVSLADFHTERIWKGRSKGRERRPMCEGPIAILQDRDDGTVEDRWVRQASICVLPQTEIASPEIVRPVRPARNRICSAIADGSTYSRMDV